MSYIATDEIPPSLAVTRWRISSPIAHLYAAFSWATRTETGQTCYFWDLHKSRIRLIPLIPGKNIIFWKWKKFPLHFFDEEVDIFQTSFARIYLLPTGIDFKWENKNFMQNAEMIADLAIRATTFQMYFRCLAPLRTALVAVAIFPRFLAPGIV